jgi:DNA-binding PadR family transcriptional regulator
MGNILSVEAEAQLLSVVEERPQGVRDLSKAMRRRTQAVVSLIKRMEAGGLVEVTLERGDGRGRPARLVSASILGESYLEAFRRLRRMPLKSSRNDLLRARADAEYVNRLIARGRDPYHAFLELNVIVRDSRNP